LEKQKHFLTLPFHLKSERVFQLQDRGHVLMFPGLDVALNRDLGLFVPVVPVIDLDIGHNARLGKVDIDAKREHLRLSASVTWHEHLNGKMQQSRGFHSEFV
jgi:hypothetical protein